MEHDLESCDLSAPQELTVDELEVVSGGCGYNCCLGNPGKCPCSD